MNDESIGQILSQARKRLGLSLKEVANKLKIRIDFLESFENDDFDINLPDIYKRGFLKIYVKFLKLDWNSMISMVDSVIIENYKISNRISHALIGQLENETLAGKEEVIVSKKDNIGSKLSDFLSKLKLWMQKTNVKVIMYLFVLFIIFISIKSAFFSSKNNMRESDKNFLESNVQNLTNVNNNSDGIILYALEDVQILVRQDLDKKPIFSGIIKRGEKKAISKNGSVQISFSNGSALLIEKNDGHQIRPTSHGRGWVRVQ